ncbi:hypothetical protein EAH86_18165 [Pedococcus bigeumensis]|uniref:Pyrroloquinoline-quinone binding quinoprotein n=1 Tax=Pedococcus bigeumensis TaxID=433644 RepID=A0A502CLP5_9MICO|nr:hypothetical protein EAH86_18165 [Pedococcus bigeumensis]
MFAGRSRLVVAAPVALLVVLIAVALYLATPHNKGVEGDWSAKAVGGRLVADRALVIGDHTALDLRSGKTVTLGSVAGGTPFVADDRLIIASAGRIDSARLDATSRWTWRSPTGTTAAPVAAARGSTAVLVCPASGTCQLVGLNAQGRQDWQTDGVARRATPGGMTPRDGSLSLVDAIAVSGGGVVVTDPVSGRSTLKPGRSFLAIPDGPLVTELVQDGRCVVSVFATADARWTRLLDTCPSDAPVLAAEGGAVTLTWPARVERLDLATGWIQPARKAGDAAREDGTVVTRAAGLTAIESRKTLHTNPFRWGEHLTVIEIRDGTTGYLRAQIVSDQVLTVLRLDKESVVVREGGEVIRLTLDSRH